jgi:ribosomal protein S18 acetylase RimI-like enzyme
MSPHFRKITSADIDQLFSVRSSVHENPFSIEELAAIEITPKSTSEALGQSLDGYLCESSDRIVGFAMVDLKTGELSVIAVLREYERRGIGRELLRLTEALLWSAGHASLWLWTGNNRSTRAFHLYVRSGWTESEVRGHQLFMKKVRTT